MADSGAWLDRARQLVDYHREALDFINRVSGQFPVNDSHAGHLSRLWVEADGLDQMVCSLLEDVNTHLIDGSGQVETTRGAAVRPSLLADEALLFECAWSLTWGEGKAVSLALAIDAATGIFEAQASGGSSGTTQAIRFPILESALKDAFTEAYVAEATF
ncbi:MAG: hypothetical protein J4N99_03990 [Chloroflexi bacterium]|nr:hypothetical protein [Chloroflexota bacterium]